MAAKKIEQTQPEPPEREFKRVGGDYLEFSRVGDTLTGEVLSKGSADFDGRKVGRYVIKAEDRYTAAGEFPQVVILGSVTLDRDMDEITVGQVVRITLDDIAKTRNNMPIKMYRVEVAG